jgi:hypothetical protein
MTMMWMDRAKCVNYRNADYVFFTEMPVAEQLEVCTGIRPRQGKILRRVTGIACPVRMECLAYGVLGPSVHPGKKTKEPLGEVYGGEPPTEIRKRQKRMKGNT